MKVETYSPEDLLATYPPRKTPRGAGAGWAGNSQGQGHMGNEIGEMLESITEGNWHNPMLRVIAKLAGRGLSESEIRLFVGPYCEQGRGDRDLDQLIKSALDKFSPKDGGGKESEIATQIFEGYRGHLLYLEDGRFWGYNGKHWHPINDKKIGQDALEFGAGNNLANRVVDYLKKRVYRDGDPLQLKEGAPPIINCQNGEVHLESGDPVLRPHSPGSRIRSVLSVEYDAEATCPGWRNFISQISATVVGSIEEQEAAFREAYNDTCWKAAKQGGARPPEPDFQPQTPGTVIFDPDHERLLQELCGLIVFPLKLIPVIAILHGVGRNGKSTLMGIMEKLVGEGFTKMKLTHFDQRFGRGNLYGRTALFDDDFDFSSPLPVALLKEISEDKVIESEVKYGGYFRFRTGCTVLINTNKLPYFKDESVGWRDRVYVIPFDRSWTGSNADRGLATRLEQELPGILNWCLEGLRRALDRNELKPPPRVYEKTQEMFDEQNSLTSFVRDFYQLDGDFYHGTELPDFKRKYRSWCADTNRLPMGDRSIRQGLEAMGIKLSKTEGVLRIRNLREVPQSF